jgi:membrane-associated phospholipid phosphatase
MATRIAAHQSAAAEQPFAVAWLVAKTLGVLCGPTVVPLWIATLLVQSTDRSVPTVDLVLFVGALGFFPALLVAVAYFTGRASDLDLSVHAERRQLVGLGALVAALGCAALALRGADPVVLALACGAAGQAALLAMLTARDKVSYHGAAGASLAASGWWLGGPVLGLAFGALALATGWSRLYLGRHTGAQVLIGLATGIPLALFLALVPAA